jgi:type I restriction enzyme S subunit
MTGAVGQRRVPTSFLEATHFPLPPTNEQKRIVAKTEELFSELDNGIAALKTAREQLKVYRQAVLKHAFEGKLTAKWREENAADAWSTEKLGDLITFLTSGSRGWAKYYSGSGDIFIRAQNLKYDRLDLNDKAYVSLPDKTEGKRTQVQFGDLLITITGANVTKTGIVDRDIGTAYVSQHVALCRPSERVCPEFLYWFLVAEAAGRRQLSKFAYGAGKPGLNLDNIRSVEINIPSLEEQLIIVANIKEQLSIEENLSQSLEEQIQRSELMRQSILKKAFSGQLVPQDPNDEPASKLLARIQAEREATKTKSTKKARKAK